MNNFYSKNVGLWKKFCENICKDFIDINENFKNLIIDKNNEYIVKKYYIEGDIHFGYYGHIFIFNSIKNRILDILKY